ncbi:MAG: ornithine cyclodeaminase family protein [Betaproteobacteria bacterium]|nr:ornithine cyclodeaminase family protein [Betaproteobacteria bacterium]
MTAILDIQSMAGVIGMREAIDLLEATLPHEAAGDTAVSPKFITDFDSGMMRILFAADRAAGYCAMKAYHNIKGAGTRYVVLLYRLSDGELLATLDGRLITDLRTGAASGIAARKVMIDGAVTVGILGSGNQARTQLESLASVYPIEAAFVFSPTEANRKAYAAEMSARLGFPVHPVASAEAAVRSRQVVASASNARTAEPILHGAWLEGCRLLCAVGNTRAGFAEVDVQCFGDAQLVVVDSLHALKEAGDLKRAVEAGALPESKQATLAQLVERKVAVPASGLVTFKSVGTALQDLALAARYYELLRDRPGIVQGPSAATLRDNGRRSAGSTG